MLRINSMTGGEKGEMIRPLGECPHKIETIFAFCASDVAKT
jgi:hypothetical protein